MVPMYSVTCLQVFGILWVVVPVLMKKYFDRLKILRYEKCRIRLLYWELML